MMSKPTNEWTGFLRIATVATSCVQNIQLLYKKLTSPHPEAISYYSEIIHDWEQFLEFCFELVNERPEPIILLLETIKAIYHLKEYLALLSLGVDIHLRKSTFEEYKASLEANQTQIKLGAKVLPKIANFILHQGLAKQLHDLNETIIQRKVQPPETFVGKLTFLLKRVFENPWRLAEILRLLRPLILMLLIYFKRGSGWTPLFAGLSIDLLSILALRRKQESATELEKQEMKRRWIGLIRYMMYSPVHEFLLGRLSAVLSPQSVIVALLSYYKCYSLIL